MADSNALPSLSAPMPLYFKQVAFDTDKLGRKELAVKMTGYIDRLRAGAVLAIDAQWGDGKTWFGRNWAQYLNDQGYKIIEIDAFAQDYIDEPFMLISAELAEVLKDNSNNSAELKAGAIAVARTILPTAGKIALNTLGKWALGTSNISEVTVKAGETAQEAAAGASQKWIEELFNSYTKEKHSINSFRSQLESLSTAQEKPIVIFIDELDRCKPTFAVRLVERLKHFFDVPNIVFVLLLNRGQLENAVKGEYGNETDAALYLAKFVNFFFKLPRKIEGYRLGSYLASFIDDEINQYKFDRNTNSLVNQFTQSLCTIAEGLNVSLRDIQKSIACFAFAYPYFSPTGVLAYIAVLKTAFPDIYRRLENDDSGAHSSAIQMLMRAHLVKSEGREDYPTEFSRLAQWHEYHLSNFDDQKYPDVIKYSSGESFFYHGEPKYFMRSIMLRFDLSFDS